MNFNDIAISVCTNIATEALGIYFVVKYLDKRDRRLRMDEFLNATSKVLDVMCYKLSDCYFDFVRKYGPPGLVSEELGMIGALRALLDRIDDFVDPNFKNATFLLHKGPNEQNMYEYIDIPYQQQYEELFLPVMDEILDQFFALYTPFLTEDIKNKLLKIKNNVRSKVFLNKQSTVREIRNVLLVIGEEIYELYQLSERNNKKSYFDR